MRKRQMGMKTWAAVAGVWAYVVLAGCGGGPEVGVQAIQAGRLMEDVRVLSSDKFEGRGPGSNGEKLTLEYLEGEFKKAGLAPGNPDGTYLQKVPLVGIIPDANMKLTLSARGRTLSPKFRDDYVAWTKRVVESASVDAEMVFVGYGVQAPEFQWDDFKGVDVKGKVIVVLVNDPPLEDTKFFGGPAMTYYGRWTYKYEKAAELGAAGCFIIHQTDRAGYGWEVVRNSWGGEQFDLATPEKNMHRTAIEGWLSGEQAQALFKLAGKDLEALKKAAATREFQPVALGVRAKLKVQNTLRNVESNNVLAKLPGSDPQLKNEYVIYCAHWDHFGVGPEVNGDKIYNGARDNATGTAALLEIARAFRQLKTPPKRSVLFLGVTGEEQGLLGSRYYAEHPLYPLARTASVVNMDALNVWGKTNDIVMIGRGASNLDELVDEIARGQGRSVKTDPEPEKGFFYRSDHFEFAKKGVPAFYAQSGTDYVGKPVGWGMEMRQQYTRENYHKPSDTIKEYWNLDGMVQDSQLFFLVGYRMANDFQVEWKPGAEFKAARDASLKESLPSGR